MDGLPEAVYCSAVARAHGNMRAVLQRIESGAFRTDAREIIQGALTVLKQAAKGRQAEQDRAELTAALAALRKDEHR